MNLRFKHFIDWFTYRENGDFHDRRNLIPPAFWCTLFLVGLAVIIWNF